MNVFLRRILVILTSPIWVPFSILTKYDVEITCILYGISKTLKNSWLILVSLTYFFGLFVIVFLLLVSLISFLYVVSKEFGYEISWFSQYYIHVSNIIKNPVSWAAATTIVATTVAIGHMENLKVNRKRFFEEQKERWKKEYEKKQKKKMAVYH